MSFASATPDVAYLLHLILSRPNPKVLLSNVSSSSPFVVSDLSQPDAPIVYCTPAFEILTGYAAAQIVGTNCRFLQHPSGLLAAGSARQFVDDGAVYRCKSAVAGGSEIQECLLNYRRGGHPFLNLVTIVPVPTYTADAPTYSIGFSLDLVENPDAATKSDSSGVYAIDYSRIAELMLMPASAPNFPDMPLLLDPSDPAYDFLQFTTSLVLVVSLQLNVIYASPSSQQLLGFAPDELLGHPISSFCHPSDISGLVRTIRAANVGERIEYLLRMRRKHDGYVWVDFSGSVATLQGDEEMFVSLIGREYHIASRVDLSQSSTDNEGMMFGASARISKSGIVLRVSSSSRTVFGRSPRELQGAQIQTVVHPESLYRFEHDLLLAAAGKTVKAVYYVRGQQDRRLAAHSTIQPGGSSVGVSANVLELQMVLARGFGVGRAGAELASLTTVTESDDSSRRAIPFAELASTRNTSWTNEVQQLQQENKELASKLESMLREQKRRRRRKSHESSASVKACVFCKTTQSPEWRRGPSGPQQLCNACGLKWIKRSKDEEEQKGPKPGPSSERRGSGSKRTAGSSR